MKRLSVVVVAVLGLALVQFVVQSTPARSRAKQEALAFQAHARVPEVHLLARALIRAPTRRRGGVRRSSTPGERLLRLRPPMEYSR